MSTNFPATLDTLTNPNGTDTVAAVDHAAQHANANDAIEALQAKVGVDSSGVTSSHDYKITQLESDSHTHTNKVVLDATTASFTTSDETKLDGVESGATANDTDANLLDRSNHTGTQTASTISDFDTEVANNAAVAANTAKNSYPSADASKLAGIESGATADQTNSEIVTAVNTELGSTAWQTQLPALTTEQVEDIVGAMFQAGSHTNITVTYDDAAGSISLSGSAGGGGGGGGSQLTQEEVEDYVGGVVAGGTGITATYDDAGDQLTISLSGVSYTTAEQTKLAGIATGATANDTDANLLTRANHTGTQTASTISDLQSAISGNTDVASNTTKLAGIESGADVTSTANVTAAGALMDSEVTNLAQVKAFDSSDYATAPQGATADSALQNVVEDTTPQLGGELDAQDNNITGAGSVSFTQELDNGSQTSSFSVDFANDQKQMVTLTANTMTITLDTTDIGVGNYILKIVNGGLATITWAAETGSVYFPGGTAPTLTSSGTDIMAVYFDGTDFYCQSSLNFS